MSDAPSSFVGFEVGIHGLTGRTELNGRAGFATGTKGPDRVAVNVLGCGSIAIKPCNLERQSRASVRRPDHVNDERDIAMACNRKKNAADASQPTGLFTDGPKPTSEAHSGARIAACTSTLGR